MKKDVIIKMINKLESFKTDLHYLRIESDTVDKKLAYQSVMANADLAKLCLLRCIDIVEKENLRLI